MSRIIFIVIAAVAVVIAATAGRYMMLGNGESDQEQAIRATIGGPFTLTDSTGKRVTDKDFQGKYMLIYFGYTFCPDVCPTSLSIMAEALDALTPEQLAKVTPVFVTVDPERDTPEVMAAYVPNFHPKLVGLTGTLEEVKAAARGYKAYYAKVNEADPDGNYTMDHSSITYLMG
ncbi:MAG TPA: SCO family protein, partial [Magnetovibrio sp.]